MDKDKEPRRFWIHSHNQTHDFILHEPPKKWGYEHLWIKVVEAEPMERKVRELEAEIDELLKEKTTQDKYINAKIILKLKSRVAELEQKIYDLTGSSVHKEEQIRKLHQENERLKNYVIPAYEVGIKELTKALEKIAEPIDKNGSD